MKSQTESVLVGELFETIAQLKSKQELEKFFGDVATSREIAEMAKRWKAAQLVDAGVSYRAISTETGLSTATITRVAEWLQNGTGGYRLALKNTHHAHQGT